MSKGTCRKCLKTKAPKYFVIMGVEKRICDFCYLTTNNQRAEEREKGRKASDTLVMTGYAKSPKAKRARDVTLRKEDLLEKMKLEKELEGY